MINTIKRKIIDMAQRVWSYPAIERAIHTAWQTFAIVFMAGSADVMDAFNKGLDAGNAALLALVLSALTASVSALKTILVEYLKSNDTEEQSQNKKTRISTAKNTASSDKK